MISYLSAEANSISQQSLILSSISSYHPITNPMLLINFISLHFLQPEIIDPTMADIVTTPLSKFSSRVECLFWSINSASIGMIARKIKDWIPSHRSLNKDSPFWTLAAYSALLLLHVDSDFRVSGLGVAALKEILNIFHLLLWMYLI